MPYGRKVLAVVGHLLQVLFNLAGVNWKPGGVTLDWSTVTAVSADTTLLDGTVVKNGQKYLRYGQVITRINKSEVQTVEFTGGPTTGGAILTLPAVGIEPAQSTTSISATATAAAFEAALQALPRVGPGGAAVTRSGAGSSGSPYIYSITWNRRMGDVPLLTATNDFGGGTTPDTTIAEGTAGTGTGLYGPYDPNATDGRQTLVRGECFILNETVTENQQYGLGAPNSDNPGVFDGGTVWKDRVLATVGGTGSLAAGPTFTNFEAAFPRIIYATEQ